MGKIRVGTPDVKHDATTHVAGIHQGNEGPYERQVGHYPDGTADARRSTGIRPKIHNAILKIMPNIPPA
jgi:hypothetical protein